MSKIFNIKRIQMTVGMLSAYLTMLILVACIDNTEDNPFGECGGPVQANAIGISLFYEPFTYDNNQYATESDTVALEDFNVYMMIEAEYLAEASASSWFPGYAYALSCAPNLDFQNITSISMTLLAPYGELAAGTDISDQVITHEDIKLSEMIDFTGSTGQYRLTIDMLPENESQLKTQTILNLTNGSQITLESTSPVLLTN